MKKFYFLLLAVLEIVTGWSKTTTWDGSLNANWDNAANWSNGVPVAGDIVIFPTNITTTITRVAQAQTGGLSLARLSILGNSIITLQATGARTITITNGSGTDLVIEAGAQLTLSTNVNLTLGAGTATIAGRFNIIANRTYTTTGTTTIGKAGIINNAGAVSSAAARLVFQDSAFYIHARNGGSIPAATWHDSSFVNINGIVNTAPGGLTQSFGNFTWNGASQDVNINLNGALRTVDGNFTIANTTDDDTLELTSATNLMLNIGGNLVIGSTGNTANFCVVKNGGGNATINLTGNYNQLAGTNVLLFDNNNPNPPNVKTTLNIAGNFIKSGGLFDFTTSDEDAGSGNNGRITLEGNFSHTGGTMETTAQDLDITNGEIIFTKNGTQTFNATNPANITFTNFRIDSGSVLQLNSNLRLSRDDIPNLKGTFIIANGGTLNTSTFNIASQGVGAPAIFTLSSGAKLVTANATGVQGAINTANLTTTLSSGADYEFGGPATGVFTTTPTARTARDIIINDTLGAGAVTLSQPFSVTRRLFLQSGVLNTTTTNVIIVNDAAIATGVPALTANTYTLTSFVDGPMRKVGNDAFVFPVGQTGAGLRRIGISAPSGGTAAATFFTAEFIRSDPHALGTTLAAGLVRLSGCEYWTLTRSTGSTNNVRVTLSWEAASNCSPADYVTDATTLRVAKFIGGTWANEGRQSSAGTNTAGTVTSGNVVNAFSPFALASSSASENPLPVIFAEVKAYEKNSGVQIEWSNLTEKDVAGYSVERSANGSDFTAIAQQSPASNQNDRADYSSFDANPISGVNYYRIRAEETTGKIVYSKVLSVNLDKAETGLRLYPNPVVDYQLTISLSKVKRGQYDLRVVNMKGQDVYKQIINSQGSTITQTLALPASLNAGVYNLVITGDGYRETKMFIVQ